MAILNCKVCDDYRSPAAAFQDKRYGKGMRVHNSTSKDGEHRCVVCETVRGASAKKAKKGKKGK